MKRVIILITFFLILSIFLPLSANASVQDEISARNQQIQELERQIAEYQKQIDENGTKAKTLSGEISKLNAQINKVQLEIKSLGIAIDQTGIEIQDTQEKIMDAQGKIELHRQALASYLRLLYQVDQENLTSVILKHATLSDFFNNLKNLEDTQTNLRATIIGIKDLKIDLEQREEELSEKKLELGKLRNLQEAQKKDLGGVVSGKNSLLKETKGQESRFQQLVAKTQKDIQKIREQITFLQQQGVTVEDAIKFGQLAAIRVGIRPAFLIAILEVESGLGRNVGTGNWLEDMYQCYLSLKKPTRAEAEKKAFFEIVGKLGLDPNSVKVSAEPNYGCGGALGPAQFLPSTWLAYEAEVAQFTGHNPPNPWNIEDAFMAAAIKLSRAGATSQTKAGETAAAKAYIGGSTRCSSRICNYYANAVLNKAAIIEQNL
ncbi:MAG: lytic murein transglycosylase [Candidatus Yanofskybacteria bacterium]|nr:lytic murein transglycosylase [Candidatus Yanofskybacteria bacterium]